MGFPVGEKADRLLAKKKKGKKEKADRLLAKKQRVVLVIHYPGWA